MEWTSDSGAQINIDAPHAVNGPDAPHVGWRTGAKPKVVGHVLQLFFADAGNTLLPAQPEVAIAVFVDVHGVVLEEALPGGDYGKFAVFEAIDPATHGSYPENSLRIRIEAARRVRRHSVSHGIGPEHSIFEFGQPTIAADPEVPLAICDEHAYHLAGKPVIEAVRRELLILKAIQTVIGADPEAAFLILCQAPNLIVGKPFVSGVHGQTAVLEAAQSAAPRAEPEAAITAFHNGGDTVLEQCVRIRGKSSIVEFTQPAFGARPYGTIPTLPDGVHRITCKAFLGCVSQEPAIPKTVERVCSVHSHPQVAFAVFEGPEDIILGQSIFGGVGREPVVGKPVETADGPDPHVAIAILEN